jgi:hypothetical protein
MPEYPYTTVPGKIKELMDKIRQIGIPENAGKNWLPSIGFRSDNAKTLLGVLKFIGFLNQNGNPTQIWQMYRGGDHGSVLAQALRDSYSDLFNILEDPSKHTASQIKDFFRGRTGSAEGTISKMADTFNALYKLADFRSEADVSQENTLFRQASAKMITSMPSPMAATVANQKAVNISIDLELPATDDIEVYRKIFQAIKEILID